MKKTARRLSAGMLALAVFMTMPGAGYCAAAENLVVSEDKAEAESEAKPVIVTEPKEASEPGAGEALGEDAKLKIEDESEEEPGRDAGDESEEEPGWDAGDESEKEPELKTTDVSGGDPKPVTTDVSGGDPDAEIMLLAEDGLTQDSVASVTVGGQTEYYDRFIDAWEAAQGKIATVRVLKDVDLELTELFINDAATDMTLEMAEGVVLSGMCRSERSFMNIQAGSLTMKSGEIRNINNLQARGVDVQGGNFTLDGGSVTAVAGKDGRGVWMSGGSFTMHGGEVIGSQYGLTFQEESHIEIDGGEITSTGITTAVKAAIFGYNSTLIIERGMFKAQGGGSTINVTGGTVEINGGSYEAEIYTALTLDSCDVTISGGIFKGGGNGGAIKTQKMRSVKISGGSFSGGRYSLDTIGESVFNWLEDGYAYYDGNGKIIERSKSSSLKENNVTVDECSHLWGEWSFDREGNHNRTCGGCGKTESLPHTFDGNGTCTVCMRQAVVSVTVSGKTDYYFFMDAAWEAAQGKTATVKVLQDVNMAGEPLAMEDPAGDITLEMAEGVTLLSEKSGNVNGEVIHVKGGNFTLAGGCVKFANSNTSSLHIEDGCAIRVNGGTVRIEGGLVKTYGTVSYAGKGPAVKVESGNFTIRGGKLEQTGYPASGLYVAGGEAAVEGGEIEGKYRGVYAAGGRTVVKGGTIVARSGAITGNSMDEYGGAVHVEGGEVIVEGGAVREEGSYQFSYGVYVKSGSISVSDGEISGGRDGICLGQNGGVIRIDGGAFTGGSGYGLRADKDQNDSVVLSGGTFTGGDRAIISASNKLMALPEEGYVYYTVENGKKELFLPSGSNISIFPKNTAVVDKCTHSYGDWKSGGDKTHIRTCAVCGMEEREACEYQYEDLSGGDGTGAGSGHAGVCSVCGGRLSQEDHVYGSWTDIGNKQCARTCTLCGRRQTAGLTRPSDYIQKVYRNSAVTVLSAQVTDAKASYVWRRQGEEAVLSTVDSYQIPVDLVVGSYAYECAVTLEGDAEPVVTWICSVRITPDSVAGSTVEVNGGSPVYFDGKAKEPPLVVTKKGVTLQEGTDYTVEYTNNTAVGTAGYTLTGMGNYKETLKGSFAVVRYETDETATAPAGWSNSAKIAAPDGYTIGFDEKGTFAPYIIYDTQTGEEGTKVSYYLRQNDTGYITGEKKVTVKVDTTLPSISAGEEGIQITDRDTWWQKLLTAVSFGYYKPQQVTIQASDALSGIAGIFYYIENAGTPIDEEAGKPAMTAEELNALGDTEWKALSLDQAGSGQQTSSASGSFGLSAEGSYVIYAYAVDRAGNRSAYICSDGIVVDTTAPVLTLAAPAGEGLRDTSAAAKLQMNEPGTVTYILSETEKSGITAGQIKADADKRERSVTARQAGTDLELPFTGLKANTAYYVYAVGTDAAGNETQSVAAIQFTTLKTAIAGAVSFAGDAVYGEILRAAIEVTAAGHGTVSCRWYRVDDAGKETEISGAVSTEYRLTADDIGFRIRVEVTAENCSGKLEAATDKIEKAAAPAEHTPVNGRVNDESGTDTFIFTGKEGVCYEYSVDGGNTWTEMTQDAFSQDAQNPERVTGTVEIGNYAYKAGQVQVRAKETETYKAGAAIQNREAFTASLEGSVVLTGETKYGETLRAETDGTQSGAVLTYSFYRSGVAAPVQTGSSAVYTLTANDIGKVISVRVTAADYTGALTAEAPQAVEKADGKEIASAVTGTSEHDMTVYTYTINPVAGAQYRMDDGDWQDSNVFADITPNTKHTFYARIAETDCYKAGAPKSTEEVTFPRLTPAAPALRYEVEEEADGTRTVVIEKVEGAEYSFDGGVSWSSGEGANVKEGCGASDKMTVGIRLRGTGTHNPSGEVLQTVDLAKKQQGLPDAYALTYQANGEEDYTVRIPETEGCEYSFDGVTWSSDPIKEGVLPGEIVTGYKRYKETATYNAGGMVSAQIQLPKFTVKTPVISPAGGSYAGTVGVTITCASPGAEIYYTTDGKEPDRSAKRYIGAFTVTVPAVVKAVAVKEGMEDSAVASVKYTEKGNGGSGPGGNGGGSSGSGSSGSGGSGDSNSGICADRGEDNSGVSTDSGNDNSDVNTGKDNDAAGARDKGISKRNAGGKDRERSVAESVDDSAAAGGENRNPAFGKPFIKGENGKEGWDVIRAEEEAAKEGSTIHVDMNGSVVVPGYIFDSIRGRDITVTFDMGEEILWRVNGRDIVTKKAKDIDFSVKRDAGSIPVDIVNKVTGESFSIQISLAYSGEFGFTAVLSIDLGRENAGYLASLYYYNENTGEMELICADEIGEDGTAELTFTHASDYVIVVEDTGEKTENTSGTDSRDNMEEKDGWGSGGILGLSGSILFFAAAVVTAVAAGIWFIIVRWRRREEDEGQAGDR